MYLREREREREKSICPFNLHERGPVTFPTHITATDLRPHIVWWNDDNKTITLVELTACFETTYEAAVERKEDRY